MTLNDYKAYRNIHKILRNNQAEPIDENPAGINWRIVAVGAVLVAMVVIMLCGCSMASEGNITQINPILIANAIYKAEGGEKTRHPYGVMTTYRHTTPRQACINTINHAYKRWNGRGDFIVFLGKTYSPPDINPNWVRLVKYFIEKDKGA